MTLHIPMNMDSRIPMTMENIEGRHLFVEMMLSSLFDNSYTCESYGIKASNGLFEYTYIKNSNEYEFSVRVVSLEKPSEKYSISYVGKPFELRKKYFQEYLILPD